VEPIVIILALGLQAFFAASETSLVRTNWVRVFTWATENRLWARRAQALLGRKEMVLITALVGTNLAVVLSSTLAERFVAQTLGTHFTFISVIVVTAASLFFAEFLPKSVAQAWPERLLCLGAPMLQIADRILWPLSRLLAGLSVVRPGSTQQFALSRKDFLFALRDRSGVTPAGRRVSGIVARLLDFPRVEVQDVMTPLARVVAIAEDAPNEQIRRLIREHRFSRYPVYEGSRENIKGVLHFRDLLGPSARRFREPLFIAAQARALEVLNRMKDQGEHFAVVRDQEQRVLGIVTLEDLLEELVGEIRSEE